MSWARAAVFMWGLCVGCIGDASELSSGDAGDDARAPDLPRADAGSPHGSSTRHDAGIERDEIVDAGVEGPDAGQPACDAPIMPSTCVVGEAATCPEGQCWFGSCVGAQLDDTRFDGCGDGACVGCDADTARDSYCPADCEPAPTIAARNLFDDSVLTVFVHGIQLAATPSLMALHYGAATDARGLGEQLLALDASLADGVVDPHAQRQLVGVEYYGATPDAALAPDDVAWIEELPNDTPDALARYARVVAVFVRDRMSLCGVESVNLLCHSMGCAVVRELVEHDLLALSSSGKLARVAGVSGAFQGARMAHMIDNPYIEQYAGAGAFNIWDIAALDPDRVRAHVAAWDHELAAADNPSWRGVLIHTLGGSDPTLDEAFNLFSLGAIHNPSGLPHDGVVFSFESLFARQDLDNQLVTTGGERLAPTHGFLDLSHNEIVDAPGAARRVHAALFARRVVKLRVAAVTVTADEESGLAPGDGVSELVLEQRVLLSGDVVDERKLEDRTPDMIEVEVGATRLDPWVVFEGPVADDEGPLELELSLVEVDRYQRYGLEESLVFDHSAPLFEGTVSLPLQDGEVELVGPGALLTLALSIVDL